MKKKKGKNKERPSRIEKYEYLNRKKKTIELEKKKNLEEKKEQRRQNLKKGVLKLLVFLLIVLSLLLVYARFIEPAMTVVNEFKITTSKIDDKMNGLKIAHFSDLHYGSTIDKENVAKKLAKVNNIEADIVIFTGDLIEENYVLTDEDKEALTASLKNIPAKLGKYAIIGNHDKLESGYEAILIEAGFTIIKNNYELVYDNNQNSILIYGLDSITIGNPSMEAIKKDMDKYESSFKILLVHEPDCFDELEEEFKSYFDLVLAGHTHNGQVWLPFFQDLILPPYGKKYIKGNYQLNATTSLYISGGLGCSTFNYRLGNPPSINFYRIIKE